MKPRRWRASSASGWRDDAHRRLGLAATTPAVLARYMDARGSQLFAGSGMLATMGCARAVCHRRGAGVSGAAGGRVRGRWRPGDVARRAGDHRALRPADQDRRHEEQLAGPDQMGAAHVPRQSRVRDASCSPSTSRASPRASASRACAHTTRRMRRRARRSVRARGPALVEAVVDPNEPLLPPKRIEKYAENMEKALRQVPNAAARNRTRHEEGAGPHGVATLIARQIQPRAQAAER